MTNQFFWEHFPGTKQVEKISGKIEGFSVRKGGEKSGEISVRDFGGFPVRKDRKKFWQNCRVFGTERRRKIWQNERIFGTERWMKTEKNPGNLLNLPISSHFYDICQICQNCHKMANSDGLQNIHGVRGHHEEI